VHAMGCALGLRSTILHRCLGARSRIFDTAPRPCIPQLAFGRGASPFSSNLCLRACWKRMGILKLHRSFHLPFQSHPDFLLWALLRVGYGRLPRLLRRFIAHVGVTGACASSTTRRNVQFDKVRARHRVSELRSVLVDRRSRGWYGQVPRGRVLEPTRREAQRAHAHHDHYERRPTRHSIRPQATTSPSGPAIAGLVQSRLYGGGVWDHPSSGKN